MILFLLGANKDVKSSLNIKDSSWCLLQYKNCISSKQNKSYLKICLLFSETKTYIYQELEELGEVKHLLVPKFDSIS